MLYFWKKETNSNQTMIQKIVLLFLIVGIMSACTKDDICTKETRTTPLLVIKFKNKIIIGMLFVMCLEMFTILA